MKKTCTGLLILFLAVGFFSCRKDTAITDPSAKLSFSNDTVLFDTVFTTVGSTTQWLQVYNPFNRKLIVSKILLAGGTSSAYRLNVDGVPGISFQNVEILPKDSIFIFIEVTIDPNNISSPMIATDSILFFTNGNEQKVQLVAWGQDAWFYNNNIVPFNYTMQKDKPHVIYNLLLVDSGATLTIDLGVTVYLHKNATLIVLKDGTLKINGTQTEPVTFRGDRLENFYKDVSGQWNRIWLSAGSKDNEINYAIIKNGIIGVQVDTLGASSNPTLKIRNTIIRNMTGAGIFAQGAFIQASNCVIANCGVYLAALTIGGNYDFSHCTFANFWTEETRQSGSILLNNYYVAANGGQQSRDLVNARFGNCILYGSVDEEIELDQTTLSQFNYTFDHCLLKTKRDVSDIAHYSVTIKNLDPAFKDPSVFDFQLGAGSYAIDKGDPSISAFVPVDILGVVRDAYPELGAYEYKP